MHGGDEDMGWRDDLVNEAVLAFLSHALGVAAREEIELPHIVVCTDIATGAVSYSGPFRDGLTALVVAEGEAELDRHADGGASMSFAVAALLPAPGPARVPKLDS